MLEPITSSRYKELILLLLLVIPLTSQAADPAPIPASYYPLYSLLDSQLDAFSTTVDSQWDGTTSNVMFSTELLGAHSSNAATLLQPDYYERSVLLELDRLQAVGVNAVTVAIHYPLLSPSFSEYIGNSSAWLDLLNLYVRLASDVRARGMKLIVESVFAYPAYTHALGPAIANYYKSRTLQQLTQERAQVFAMVAEHVRPDYLSLGSEPDSQAKVAYQPELATTEGWLAFTATLLSRFRSLGVSGVRVGAGVGTWLPNASEVIAGYAAMDLDFIDLHVYPVNQDLLTRAILHADQITSMGKRVSISEAWLNKEWDHELGTADQVNDITIFSRNSYSFWAPLDQKFTAVMAKFTHWKNVEFFSPYWSRFYFAYLDYDEVEFLTPSQLETEQEAASSANIAAGVYTDTGVAYARMIDSTPPATLAGLAAVGASTSAIVLTWRVETGPGVAAGYRIYRDGVWIADTAQVYYRDENLAPGQKYSYRMSAYDVAGHTSGLSAAVSGKTLMPPDVTPPTAPGNLTAEIVDETKILLRWTPSQDAVGVRWYKAYRNGKVFAGVTETQYLDVNIVKGVSYTYEVQAYDAAGNMSPLSNRVSITVPIPVSVTAQSVAPRRTSATVYWLTNIPSTGIVFYGPSPQQLTSSVSNQTVAPLHSSTIPNLTKSTVYYYSIVASSQDGSSTFTTPVATFTTANR